MQRECALLSEVRLISKEQRYHKVLYTAKKTRVLSSHRCRVDGEEDGANKAAAYELYMVNTTWCIDCQEFDVG